MGVRLYPEVSPMLCYMHCDDNGHVHSNTADDADFWADNPLITVVVLFYQDIQRVIYKLQYRFWDRAGWRFRELDYRVWCFFKDHFPKIHETDSRIVFGWGKFRPHARTPGCVGHLRFPTLYLCHETEYDVLLGFAKSMSFMATMFDIQELFKFNEIELTPRQWELLEGVCWG